jgi:AcrR family transcriptional regulator
MARMTAEMGLRERKKQRTREQIADAAWGLFAERGFEQVPVSEIAAAADVSEATVFNYFRTKEDLVFHRMEAFEEELLETIRDRPAGESIVQAFGRFVLRPRGFLGSDAPAASEGMRTVAQVMSSPALQARQRDILDHYTDSLASLIARERGRDPRDVESWVVANALLGLHRELIAFTHRQALAGVDNRRIARNLRAQGKRALAALEHGLG